MIDAHLHCHFKDGQQKRQLEKLKKEMQKYDITKAVLYLTDDNDYEQRNFDLNFGKDIIPAMMLDPRDLFIDCKLKELQDYGVKMIKLLPYEQQIFYKDFEIVCEYAMKVQDHGMILTICGSYGSKDVYRTNGVELAAQVLNTGFKNPLIIAHGGMDRQLDTHSLMCEYPNLFIDISFTIPYWWGSHLISDLDFVLRKGNYEKAFWGSDYPYYTFKEEIDYFNLFCEKYSINEFNKEKLLFGNFEKFYEEYLR